MAATQRASSRFSASLIYFRFAPFIALEHAFCGLTLIAIGHRDPFPS
jgi:hypothetical protein